MQTVLEFVSAIFVAVAAWFLWVGFSSGAEFQAQLFQFLLGVGAAIIAAVLFVGAAIIGAIRRASSAPE